MPLHCKQPLCVDQPELYLSWTSFTNVTLAERRKMPSISKPDAKHTKKEEEEEEKGVGEGAGVCPVTRPAAVESFLVVAFYEDVELSRAAVAEDQDSPWSERKPMVSLITTGTQSPSGLLCRSLTQNSEGGLQSSA